VPPRWGLLFVYACIAGLSHILLDFTNNYGVRPFWPFSERWYSWDIVFIVEPVMLVLLILGLVVPALFNLIDKEIGARRRSPRGSVAATLALVGIVVMWGLRDYEHRRAVNALAARTYEGADPLRVSAYPHWIDPFHWDGVVETPALFALAPVESLGPEVDPEGRLEIRYKPEETPITLAAKKSYLGRVYLDWAQYPITETETLQPPQEGYIVRLQDLRYMRIPSAISRGRGRRRTLGAAIMLDKNLRVVGDVYDTDKGQVVVPEPGSK
jgi:inner membrane protein